MDNPLRNYYVPIFEELKDRDNIQVLTSYGWVGMVYPNIKETMFMRRSDTEGFETAVKHLISSSSIMKKRPPQTLTLKELEAYIKEVFIDNNKRK